MIYTNVPTPNLSAYDFAAGLGEDLPLSSGNQTWGKTHSKQKPIPNGLLLDAILSHVHIPFLLIGLAGGAVKLST